MLLDRGEIAEVGDDAVTGEGAIANSVQGLVGHSVEPLTFESLRFRVRKIVHVGAKSSHSPLRGQMVFYAVCFES